MNEKYQTTLRSKKPYYSSLIWVTLDKYKKRLKRMKTFEEEYEKVEFEKVEMRKTNLPIEFIMNNSL